MIIVKLYTTIKDFNHLKNNFYCINLDKSNNPKINQTKNIFNSISLEYKST